MIAKIVKGSSFKGVVNYILDKEKDAKILVCDGMFAEDKDTIAMSFEAQSKMNPKVTKPVGHISLAFSKEDRPHNGWNSVGIPEGNGNNRHADSHRAPL